MSTSHPPLAALARTSAVTLAIAAIFLTAPVAHALKQPNGTTIPTPLGCAGGNQPFGLAATFACICTQPNICNIGAPCTQQGSCDTGVRGTCETTLWHNFNDNTCIPSNLKGLDPQADAATTPETFRPTCPLTFTVLTRGQARFANAFGWYNVTGSPPQPSDLHTMLDCKAAAGTKVVLDLRGNPDYKGGDIGFFLVTPEQHGTTGQCAGGDCCATTQRAAAGQGWVFYSQPKYNPDQAGANSFIHLITYNSKITSRKFYFAWEDIYGGSDNEFMDLVTSVEGVECTGGGTPCDTGKKGICGLGFSQCEAGVVTCTQLYQGQSERCDGLDNDCDGVVDNGASCDPGTVCWNGECTPHCAQSAEFACLTDYTCDKATGLCIDPTCAGVSCAADKVCRKGQCTGACDGIVCPKGRLCRLGNCIDPCRGVTCAAGKVCVEGLCVAGCGSCGGLVCIAPLACDGRTGACTDPSCPNGCPAGTACDSGTCKDACIGAVCPRGMICDKGDCELQTAAADGGIPIGFDLKPSIQDLAVPPEGSDLLAPKVPRSQPGCDCTIASRPSRTPSEAAPLALALALIVIGALLRRRRGM